MAVSQPEELITKHCKVDSESNEICKINENTNIEESSIDTAPFASMPTEDEGIYLTDTFMHTNEIRVENNLLKLVSDMNAPNDAFKNIVDWAKDAFSTGYQFNPKTTNYKNQIKQMENLATSNLSGHLTRMSYCPTL